MTAVAMPHAPSGFAGFGPEVKVETKPLSQNRLEIIVTFLLKMGRRVVTYIYRKVVNLATGTQEDLVDKFLHEATVAVLKAAALRFAPLSKLAI